VNVTEARRRFSAERVARLATTDASGHPHLVPIVFAVSGETIYSAVDAKPKRSMALRRLANVAAANPLVAILVDHYVAILVDHYEDADWGALWWIRAEAPAACSRHRTPKGVTRSRCWKSATPSIATCHRQDRCWPWTSSTGRAGRPGRLPDCHSPRRYTRSPSTSCGRDPGVPAERSAIETHSHAEIR